MPFLADLVRKDLDAVDPDADRASGFLLRTVLAWREGNVGQAFDPSGDPIDPLDGNKVAEHLLRPALFEAISTTCKSKFVTLHPDNWYLFRGVDAKAVVERVLKKYLPITNAQPASHADGKTGLASMLESFIRSLGAIQVVTMAMDIVERSIDHAEWAKHVVNEIDDVLADEPLGHSWFLNRCAVVIQGCQIAAKRRVFERVLRQNGVQSVLIDSLLRAGNISEDKGEDIIELLDTMDKGSIATFMKQDARVVHVNYFLRLYALRTTPITKRKTPSNVRGLPNARLETIKELKDTIAVLSKRNDDESRGRILAAQERLEALQREGFDSKRAARALDYLKLANPWALDRQFTSWSKRISDTSLDQERVNVMKGFITKQLDAARHALETSDELAPFFVKKYKSVAFMEASGARHLVVKVDDLVSLGVPGALATAVRSWTTADGQAISSVHVLDFGTTQHVPPYIPANLKGSPWIALHKGDIIGIGFSGCRAREIPEAILDLPKLRVLDLSNNVIKDAGALGSWPSLRHLDLSRNLLASFVPTVTRSGVKFLDLHCNALKDADMTAFSGGIKVLDLSRNQFTSMEQVKGLSACQKLGTLNLAWNKLDSLQGFPAMNRLVMLFLNGNGLVKLGSDATLPSVRRLDLSDNNLGALKGIGNFPAVFHVDARRNYLKNVGEVDSMPHLRDLIASNNQIESPGNLLQLKKLRVLDLRSNPLSKVEKETDKARYLSAPVRL